LTTHGGYTGYARAIYEELILLQERIDLTFIARGICLSSGVTVAMAFPVERRLATRNTKFLIHDVRADTPPSITGTISERKIANEVYKKGFKDDKEEGKWVINLIAKGCNRSVDEVERDTRSSLWLIGKKAVKYGLISGLVSTRK
jgi:ATP-dependent Clp protease protease subunit